MFDSKQFLGELPAFISIVLEKITSFPGLKKCTTRLVDQLTGKGLFPQPYNYWGLVGFGFVVKRNERKLSVVHTRNAISPLALYDIVY